MADDQPERNGDQRRNRHGRRGVFQMLERPGRQPDRTYPVLRGEQVGQRLADKVHRDPPATGAVSNRRPGRVTRAQGVAIRPANISATSMMTANTKMARIPATIWSLLFAWSPSVNQVPTPPMPLTAPTETIEMLVTTTTRRPATSTGIDSGSSTLSSLVIGR